MKIDTEYLNTTPCDRCTLPVSLNDGAEFCSCNGIYHQQCFDNHLRDNPEHESV